jgi:hypothetical protein
LAALTFFVAAQLAAQASEDIVGGSPVPTGNPVEQSTAALVWEDVMVCSGVILDSDILLTAAHCLGEPKEVVFGIDAAASGATRRPITGALAHPGFDLASYDKDPIPANLDDIAVVRFDGGLPPGAMPALLAGSGSAFATGDLVTIAGFGVNDASSDTDSGIGRLRQARVAVLDASYSVSEFKIDATRGAGDCSGDSGGPAFADELTAPLTVLGIDNWGPGACSQFGVYARVSFHRAWIEQAILSLRTGSAPASSLR